MTVTTVADNPGDRVRAAEAPLAFITGASSGIGQALALAYARSGWRLALVARRVDTLRSWARAQALDDQRCACYEADVRDIDRMADIGRSCLVRLGLPQVVIASAGISVGIDTSERPDLDVLDDLVRTNLLGTAATFHPFIAPMRVARAGRLVGISSVAAVRGLPGHGGYCASKAGVSAYCESLRGELRADGIRVVTLMPGFIDTPMTRGNPYPMPFFTAAEDFAEQARIAIDRGVSRRVIPWQMGTAARLLRWLPDPWFDGLIAGRGRKPRRR